MAAETEKGEVSLILLSCNGEPLISTADSIQHIVVDRSNLPSEMRQIPADELALQQIMGMPEGSFAVVHIPPPILEVAPTTDEDFEKNLSGELLDSAEEVKKDCSISSSVDWSHKMTLMLLDCYRIHLDEFNNAKVRKKTVWGKIALSMEQAGYGNLTWRACAKKFYNLRSTFQGMTESQRKSGCKKWPYYDLFDNLFGVSSSNLSMQGDENCVQMRSVKRLRMSKLEKEPNDFSDIFIRDESTQVTTAEIQTISWPGEIILEASMTNSLVVDANSKAADQSQKKEFSNGRSSATSVEWTHNLTMLLLELYQAHVDDFKNDRIRKKTTWARIASGIQSAGYAGMTWEACEKKFRNLKCTYRTIIENKKKEQGRTKWPYYDIFHELFNVTDAKLLVNVAFHDQDSKHDKSSLELECKSVPAALADGDMDTSNSVENAWSCRKRKILPPRSLLTDFVTSFSKPEHTRIYDHGNEDAESKHCAVELEDESVGSGVEWTRTVTLLLLALYQNHVSDFENRMVRKKTVWGRIAASLKAEGYDNMTWDVCEKKFRNLRSTYRTIMESSRSTGHCRTKWPYFDHFNNLFGQSYESGVEVYDRQEKIQNDSKKRHEASLGTATDCSDEISEVVNSPKNKHRSTVTGTWLGTPTSLSAQHKDVENYGESASRPQDISETPDKSAKLSFKWTRDTILLMLDLYQIHLDDFKRTKILKKKLWMQIASALQSSGLAGRITWDMCAKKFRNLKCTYWSIAEHNKRTGHERKKWPYYKHFSKFFGCSPSTLNCRFETDNDDDDSGECLQKGSVQPPQWFLSFINEIQTAEENRLSLLQQMHAEQKQQAAEHMATLNELSSSVRQLVDKLTITAM